MPGVARLREWDRICRAGSRRRRSFETFFSPTACGGFCQTAGTAISAIGIPADRQLSLVDDMLKGLRDNSMLIDVECYSTKLMWKRETTKSSLIVFKSVQEHYCVR